MGIEILVEALGILHIAGVGVESVEAADQGAVPAGAIVILLTVGIEVLTGVEEIGGLGRGPARKLGAGWREVVLILQQYAVAIIAEGVGDTDGSAGPGDELPRAAVTTVEQVFGIAVPGLGDDIITD